MPNETLISDLAQIIICRKLELLILIREISMISNRTCSQSRSSHIFLAHTDVFGESKMETRLMEDGDESKRLRPIPAAKKGNKL